MSEAVTIPEVEQHPKRLQSFFEPKHDIYTRDLLCALAVERRENAALRKDNDAKARRIDRLVQLTAALERQNASLARRLREQAGVKDEEEHAH